MSLLKKASIKTKFGLMAEFKSNTGILYCSSYDAFVLDSTTRLQRKYIAYHTTNTPITIPGFSAEKLPPAMPDTIPLSKGLVLPASIKISVLQK